MKSRRGSPIVLALVLVGVAGCGMLRPPAAKPGLSRLPLGRTLVIARIDTEENRPIAETAEDLLVRSLREAGEVVGSRDFFAEALGAGHGLSASPLVDRIQRGGAPITDELGEALDRFGIWTVVVLEVPTYEQVWGKYAKFTRVGLEARAFHLPSRKLLWRAGGSAEVEAKRGRAFQLATEQAVQELASAIRPEPGVSLMSIWRSWRR